MVDGNAAALDGVLALEPGCGSFSALRADGSSWVWGHEKRPYAASFATDVVAIGYATDTNTFGPLYLTSDGVLHNGQRTAPIVCPSTE